MPPDAHRPHLDTLRLLAVLAVFAFHLDEKRFAYGWMGVPLFFVLSGFLITRLLLLHDTGSPGRDLLTFYARRTLRIFPLYYATLLVLMWVGWLPRPGWYFAYLMNVDFFLTNDWPGRTVHFWTLCVEEQFYLLCPVALLLWPRAGRLGLLAGLLAGSMLFRSALDRAALARPGVEWRSYLLLPYVGEYLLWGALAGWADLNLAAGRVPAGRLFLAGWLLHAAAAVDHFHAGLLGRVGLGALHQTAHGVGFALVVFGLWRIGPGPVRRLFALLPFIYLGRISYGLYVFHNLTFGVKAAAVPYVPALAAVPGAALALLTTVGLAVASWHLFEGPINRLKRHFPYPAPSPVGEGGGAAAGCPAEG